MAKSVRFTKMHEAKKCAIEFHSYSKTAGFTGVRCGYTVIPKEITVVTQQVKATIDYYMSNAHYMHEQLTSMGFQVFGGRDDCREAMRPPDNGSARLKKEN